MLTLVSACKKTQDPMSMPPTTDTYAVSVVNGYGSGSYKVGDTVHVFSSHYANNQLFDKWSGDVTLLKMPAEWHTWFIMPDRNVTLTGSIKSIPPFTLQYEQIRGKARLKPVYSYFPANHKGVVYLLHGTSGQASSLVNSYEYQLLIRELVNDNFGVIVTEAEESTTGVDANGDGKLRWESLPVDTINGVDYANVRLITNVFYARGTMSRAKPRYSIGMSNGGFYSVALATAYGYKAGVSYCAQGVPAVVQATQTPVQFCMARNDSNDGVGQAGNATALTNANSLNARGVCSKYFVKERCPVYAERFARRSDITASQSVAIFNELKAKGYIDGKGYYRGTSEVLATAYAGNPTSFPAINGLTGGQRLFVLEQIELCVSEHQMFSDFNRATVKFLNIPCQ